MQQQFNMDLGLQQPIPKKKLIKRKNTIASEVQVELCFKLKKPRFSRQKIAKFFNNRYGERGKSIAKRFRRLKKYKLLGQYRYGVFYCKSEKPITQERLDQYDRMCHKIVRKFLPALALYEKSYNYDDLVISCRREVFLALLDGFDPIKAMTSTLLDPQKRKLAEHYKIMNREKTLSNSEKNIVWGRLKNWVRRERFKYSPQELGGRTEALEVYIDGKIRRNEIERGVYNEIADSIPDEIHEIKDRLLNILAEDGPEAVLKAYQNLEDSESDMVLRLLTQSDNPLSKMMPNEE